MKNKSKEKKQNPKRLKEPQEKIRTVEKKEIIIKVERNVVLEI
jgi:hypothetical protein